MIPRGGAESPQGSRRSAGEYQLLRKYLVDRFADRVVLTFAEIEDILGFALPDAARAEREWWDSTDQLGRRSQSDAWMLANRTAEVNLASRRVVFERITTIDSHSEKR